MMRRRTSEHRRTDQETRRASHSAWLATIATTIITLFVIMHSAAAQTIIVDATTGNEIASAIVMARIDDRIHDYLITPTQRLEWTPLATRTTLEIIDDSSQNVQYMAVVHANASPLTIIAHPAGVLFLQVKDDRDNFVSRCLVTVTCQSLYAETTTDRAGFLRIVLPTEDCIISASAHDRASSIAYRIEQGQTETVNMTLVGNIIEDNESSTTAMRDSSIFVLAALGVAFVISIFILHRGRLRQRDKGNAGAIRGDAPITASLTAKEKVIVDQLVVCGGKMTLSALRTNTRLPRTSLLRTLESLERRNVTIKKTEHGKVMVELMER